MTFPRFVRSEMHADAIPPLDFGIALGFSVCRTRSALMPRSFPISARVSPRLAASMMWRSRFSQSAKIGRDGRRRRGYISLVTTVVIVVVARGMVKRDSDATESHGVGSGLKEPSDFALDPKFRVRTKGTTCRIEFPRSTD